MARLENDTGRSTPKSVPRSLNGRVPRFRLRQETWLPALLVVAVALLVWEMSVHAGILSALFFPAPSTIARKLAQMLVTGDLLADLGATVSRLGLGLMLGGGLGLMLGLAMGWSRRLRTAVDPLVAAGHAIPMISILPLAIIVFGIGEASKIVLITGACFFPMLISTMSGVRQISPLYFEVAENYGASPAKVFTRVILPGSLPLVLSGVRLSLNVGLALTIAVELVTAQKGLGATIWLAWETLRTEQLYVALVTTMVLGIGFNRLLQLLLPRLAPWQVERER